MGSCSVLFIVGSGCRWKRSKRGFHEVLHMFHDLAECLEVVHRAGRVHRDIKPGNALLMLSSHCWRLLDFCIAATAGALTESSHPRMSLCATQLPLCRVDTHVSTVFTPIAGAHRFALCTLQPYGCTEYTCCTRHGSQPASDLTRHAAAAPSGQYFSKLRMRTCCEDMSWHGGGERA
jgi:serine/threonine protein kinase